VYLQVGGNIGDNTSWYKRIGRIKILPIKLTLESEFLSDVFRDGIFVKIDVHRLESRISL